MRSKKILLLVIVLLLSPILPTSNTDIVLAEPSMGSLPGPDSNTHRRYDQSLWEGALSNDSSGLERWLLKSVNIERNKWHQWHVQNGYSDWQIKVGYESQTAYNAPEGYWYVGIST